MQNNMSDIGAILRQRFTDELTGSNFQCAENNKSRVGYNNLGGFLNLTKDQRYFIDSFMPPNSVIFG